MNDLKERLASVFHQGLVWAWHDIKIEIVHVKGRVPVGYEPPEEAEKRWQSGEYVMIDPTMEYVEIKIYFPESYKKEFPDWVIDQYAAPLPNRCAHILHALGLGSMLADSLITKDYVLFYTHINKEVYDRLPPVMPHQLPCEVTATSNIKHVT